jgi:hypothetical protein
MSSPPVIISVSKKTGPQVQIKELLSATMDISGTEDIVFLARLIASETDKIAAHLSQNERAFPSFGVDGPPISLISPEATDVETARLAVIDATQRLRTLIMGPRDYLMNVKVCCPSCSSHLAQDYDFTRHNSVTTFWN